MENLVIQTAFLGDLLLSIPLLRSLKKTFPDHPLTLVCRKGFGGLIQNLKVCDHVIEIDKTNAAQRRHTELELRRKSFHMIFCPHESYRSACLVYRLKAKHKVGFYHWWNFFAFQTRILRPLHYPEALRQLSLLRAIGHEERDWSRFTNSKVRKTTLEFLSSSIPEVASMSLRPAPKKTEKNLLIAPGSVWPTKQWTASGFKEVAQYFSSKGFRVCFVGSEQERRLCEEMARAIPGCENLAGQLPWPELLELMHQSAALVCNDSGAMHLATLVNLPIVSIFGPTTLDLGYRPWTEQAVVVQKDLTCRPCGKHGAKVCPLGTHACMKQISSQTVIEAVEFLIEKTHPTH